MGKPENWREKSEEELESDCDESSGFERSIEKAAGEEDEGTDGTVHEQRRVEEENRLQLEKRG